MRNLTLALLLAILGGSPLAKASDAGRYPQTAAVLQLLYNDEFRVARTYYAFGRQAHAEKHLNIESFFAALEASAMTRAETTAAVLSQMGLAVIEPDDPDVRVSSTKLNLKLMANIEAPKMEKRYPLLLEQIKPEGHAVAIQTVSHAWKVDKGHRELAEAILSSMESFFGIGARMPSEFYVCQNCGAVNAGVPELTCPVCQGPISDYELAHAKWRFYRAIDENSHLSDEERAFAKRMYDHIYTTSDPSAYVSLGMSDLYSDAYKKWGLGARSDFCLEEKIYIAQLEDMARMWETYQTIDTDSLDAADQAFLEELHDKYGDGPINLRREKARERGKDSPEVQELLNVVEIVCGRTELADQDLIFFRSLIAKAGAAG